MNRLSSDLGNQSDIAAHALTGGKNSQSLSRAAWVILALFLLAAPAAWADLTVTPITWDVVGLDHNRPLTSGPELFPVGARVCTDTNTSNVEVEMVWDEPNSFIFSRPGSLTVVQTGPLDEGDCFDAYFEIQLQRSASAFGQSRQYRILATDDDTELTFSSPTPRAIFIERLVSQNRNSTNLIRWGQEEDESDWVTLGAGGGLNLAVGETYFIELTTQTATAYEQLQSFLTLSNTIFQVKSVETSYGVLTAPPSRVPVPNPSLYADGCLWDPDLNSPNYNSCLDAGKAGGLVVTTYEIDIIAGGGDSVGLLALIYDKSGGSFHYNTDFSRSPGEIIINDPSDAGFAKRFIPSTIGAGGTATLRFTISNPNPFTVEGYRFDDTLPGNMEVADPANASSTCGGTLTAVPGSGEINFEDGVIGASSSCTILVTITVPFDAGATYPVELDNMADLFVGDAEDPSDTAEATLIVTEEAPPPLECVDVAPGTELARWDSFNNASTPAPTFEFAPGMAAAQAGTGLDFVVVNPEWRAEAQVSGQTLADARVTSAYYEFRLDTTGLDSVDFRATIFRQNNNAPQAVTLDYGPEGSLVQSLTLDPVPNVPGAPAARNFIDNGLINLNPNGETVFRLYAYQASGTNNPLRARDVLMIGEGEVCSPIDPADAPESPVLSKSFIPDEVFPGQVSTLTFTIDNPNAADALSGITFRDELPAGMTSVGGFVNNGCGGTWGLEVGDPTILLLTDGSLAAAGSCTLDVDVISTAVGANVNISDPIDATETLPGNSAIGTLEVLPPPLLPSIAKFFDPNPLLDPDGTTTLVFEITNTDSALTVSSVTFSDVLPLVGTVQMQPVTPFVFDDNGFCGPAFSLTWDGIDTLSFSGGEIIAGDVCQIEVEVEVPGLDPLEDLPALFPNQTSPVSHVFEGIVYEGNQAGATLLVDEPIPGIVILKQVGLTDDPDGAWSNYLAIPLDGELYYKLTIENIGETVLADIDVSDPDVDTSGCPWEIDPTLELPVADVGDPEAHIAICIIGPITADVAGEFVNVASVTAMSGADEVDDQDSAIYATSELTLVKTADPETFVEAGDIINYEFLVSNTGDAILTGPVQIDDPLIGAVVCPNLTTIGNNDNFFDPGEFMICTGSYSIDADDVAAGFVTNVAFAFSPEAVSNIDDATVTLLTPAISVSKSADPVSGTTVNAGDTITYSVEVVVSDTALTDVFELTDTLSAGLSLGTVTAGAFTCNATNPLVCSLPSGTAQGTYVLTYTATVDPDASGTLNNAVVISGNGGDPDPQCLSCVTNHPLADPDVSVAKSADPISGTEVSPGQTLSYTLTVTVSDAATTAAVVLVDTLGAGLTVDSVPAGCVAAGQEITCTLASGAVPDVYTFEYTATVDSDATVSVGNSVVIDEGGGDPDPACPSCDTDHPVTDASVTVNKSADPVSGTQVTAGQTIAYTLSVDVSDSATTDAVVLTDTLGAGLTLVLASLPAECGAVGQVVTCTLASGSLPGNYTFEYDATVDADATVSVGNSVEVTGGDDPVCGTCETVHPLADPDVSVAKSADPISGTEVSPGQTLSYTLTVTVSDAATTADVVLVDTLGAGLTVDSVPAGCVAAGQEITCTLASGAVPDVYTFEYTATVDSDATVSVGNSVVIDEGGGDPDPACPSCDTDHPVTDASVTVNKSADPVSGTQVTAGQTIAYTLSVDVSDSATTDAVVLTDTLGAGLTLVLASLPVECGAVGQVVTCTLASGSLPGNYTFEYDATVDADATVSVGNSVEAAGGDDPVCGTCETVHPLADPDVSVAKSADPISGTEVSPGQTLSYTLTVTVSDAATTAAVVLVDTLGAGLTVDSVPAGCVAAGQEITCTLASGAVPDVYTFEYTATVDSDATVSVGNSVVIDEGGGDPDPACPSCDTDHPVTDASVTVNKSADPVSGTPVTAGQTIAYTLSVDVSDSATTDAVVLTDTLGAGLTLDAGSLPAECGAVGQEVTCTLASGSLPGNYTFEYDATVDADATVSVGNSVEAAGGDDPVCGTCETVHPLADPDVSVAKSADPISGTEVSPGQTLSYTLSVTVSDAATTAAVVLVDTLGAGLTVDSVPAGCVAAGQEITCTLASGAVPDVYTFEYTATVDSDATVSVGNSVVIDEGGGDPDPACPSCDTDHPVAVASLSLIKEISDAPDPIAEGSVLEYTITATNSGDVTLSNVVVDDDLITPSSVTCATVMPGNTCVLVGVYTVTAADMASGEIINIATANGQDPQDNPVPQQTATEITLLGEVEPHPVPIAGWFALLVLILGMLVIGLFSVRRRDCPMPRV